MLLAMWRYYEKITSLLGLAFACALVGTDLSADFDRGRYKDVQEVEEIYRNDQGDLVSTPNGFLAYTNDSK